MCVCFVLAEYCSEDANCEESCLEEGEGKRWWCSTYGICQCKWTNPHHAKSFVFIEFWERIKMSYTEKDVRLFFSFECNSLQNNLGIKNDRWTFEIGTKSEPITWWFDVIVYSGRKPHPKNTFVEHNFEITQTEQKFWFWFALMVCTEISTKTIQYFWSSDERIWIIRKRSFEKCGCEESDHKPFVENTNRDWDVHLCSRWINSQILSKKPFCVFFKHLFPMKLVQEFGNITE